MKFIRKFSSLTKEDVQLAGGKGASLGEMLSSGIPVPDGFVVVSTAFEEMLKQSGIERTIKNILDELDYKNSSEVSKASETIAELILSTPMPDETAREIMDCYMSMNMSYVAVRSSSTSEDSQDAAWAGQLDSFLNTQEDSLLENVKRCWASLFTPRAIFYRYEKNMKDTVISVAVVVQKMIQSEVSGIAFSVHPVTTDPSRMIIEAGMGLGEAVVSGQITPDNYTVHKTSLEIEDKYISEQERKLIKGEDKNIWVQIPYNEQSLQKLSDDEIKNLAQIVKKIENHYQFPCDIEWAYESNNFYIVQSRPITTL